MSVDVLISVIWIAVEPMERRRTVGTSFIDPLDPDAMIVPLTDSCSSPNMGIFTGIIIAYKSIIILGGAALAVLTQKVNIAALNDSRQIGLCIYTVALVTGIVMPLLYFVGGNSNVSFVFGGVALWFNTTSVIAILFFHKVYTVWTGKHEEKTMTMGTRSNARSSARSSAGGIKTAV
jgi:gamma-aminobutyric acid type B receptor